MCRGAIVGQFLREHEIGILSGNTESKRLDMVSNCKRPLHTSIISSECDEKIQP